MKIGIDIRCLMERHYSGISEYTHNLLTELFKIDSANQYILFYNSAQQSAVPTFTGQNIVLKEFQFPNKLFNLGMRFLKITEIDTLIGGVDVFIMPNFLFVNLSANCAKVIIVHDLSFEYYPKFFTLKKRLWHHLINPRRLCRQADKIIAISQNTRQDLIKLYQIDPEKISVIYPGVNEIYFKPVSQSTKKQVKNKYRLPERYCFYLGNLEPRKNVETLIAAFEKITDDSIHLVIAGHPAWKYKNINQLYRRSTRRKRIHFLGYVAAVDKPALYSLAELFVYPSIYEGFGLPPLEAMAVGTPVVTGFGSSLPESVGTAGLLVDPNNINELTTVIDQLTAGPNLRQQLSQAGQQHSQQFRWSQTAKKILTVINGLK